MKTFYSPFRFNLKRALTILGLISLLPVIAISQGIWTDSQEPTTRTPEDRQIIPQRYRTVKTDIPGLQQLLGQAPLEQPDIDVKTSSIILTLPMPDGTMQRFSIIESPIMDPDLAARYPAIKTYLGQGIDDRYATLRCDFTSHGFHASILSPNGAVFIDPYQRGDIEHYISYYKKDFIPSEDKIMIEYDAKEIDSLRPEPNQRAAAIPSGTELRTYRLALAVDSNYYNFQGGTDALVMAAVVTSMNRVNQVYEAEVAIRMVLISNTDDLFFDGSTSPYPFTTSGACGLRPQNQSAIDAEIGNGVYDIGHLFAMSSGGCAAFNSVCNNDRKAWGVTGTGNPVGDPFDIDYVSHEIGHQFNGAHTWNGTSGSCSAGQYSGDSAFEPGSGSTIMAYAGICSGQNLQPNSDPYFHTRSFDQIVSYSTTGTGNGCPTVNNTGNNYPSVNAGANYTIPMSTPFILTGSASDPDSDALTYCWEEYDLGPAGAPNDPTTMGPIFRSFNPVMGTSRTFPQLSDILGNTTTIGELLPTIGRTMTFRLTARDNRAGGGGVNYDNMNVIVHGDIGPFAITSFNTSTAICPGSQTIMWDVNGSDALASHVNILLSYDSGNSFPISLATNTPNDGSASVIIPCTYNTTARFKIEGAGNVFFDISNANVTVGDNTKPDFTTPADITLYTDASCLYNASVAITGDVVDETDNCSSGIQATDSDLVTPGSCDGEVIITRTWTLTDDCGNTKQKDQIITVTDTTSPTFTVPADVTIYKDARCSYDASLSITGDVLNEADNCSTGIEATYGDSEAPGACEGETIITRTWTLEDDCGNTTVKDQLITAQDTTSPTFTVPPDITIYKDADCNYDASLSETGDVTDETDNCDTSLDAIYADAVAPGSCIGEEIITRTWMLTDDCGNSLAQVQVITATDSTGPVIADVNPDPPVLWPPNHKMRTVEINYTSVDNCSSVINSLSVTSNEPANDNGDGNTEPDWIIIDEHEVQLRAERNGPGSGRTYTITITSIDDCGNISSATTEVIVPHDKDKSIALREAGTSNPSELNVEIWPNPARNNFNITLWSDDSNQKIEVTIYDIYGRILDVISGHNGSRFSFGNDYLPGNYFVKVIQGAELSKVYKLIKVE